MDEFTHESIHGLSGGRMGATLKRASVLELSSKYRGEGGSVVMQLSCYVKASRRSPDRLPAQEGRPTVMLPDQPYPLDTRGKFRFLSVRTCPWAGPMRRNKADGAESESARDR